MAQVVTPFYVTPTHQAGIRDYFKAYRDG